MLLSSAAICLAANIYFEARNQPVEGQFAVAYVTLNRAKTNNTSICTEVLRPKQFSWTAHKVQNELKKPAIKPNEYPKHPDDAIAFRRAFSIANIVLNPLNNFKDVTEGATFFHSQKASPFWKKDHAVQFVKQIGDHLFYSLKSKDED